MRHYELVVVLSPMLNQDQVSEAWEKIKGFITTREAEISHEEQWGTRRLAYPIRKGQHRFLEGSYHLTRFATERSFNIELENFLKVDDEVLRSLVTVTLPEEKLAAQAAAAARAIRTPPPRPAPIGPDGSPLPAEGAPPVSASPEGEASPAEAPESADDVRSEGAPVSGEAAGVPAATVEEEAELEAEPEPEEDEPAASEGSDSTGDAPEELASDPDDSEE